MCTAAVRNCLECRHRYSRPSSEPPSPGGAGAAGGKPINGVDPIQSLIGGSHPSTKVGSMLYDVGGDQRFFDQRQSVHYFWSTARQGSCAKRCEELAVQGGTRI